MKKFISILLAITLVLMFNATTIFAADAAVGKSLTYYDGTKVDASGNITRASSASSPVNKTIVRSETNKYTGNVTSENGYVNVSYPSMKSNYRTSLLSYMATNPVFSIKYDINIPIDTNSAKVRTFKPQFSSTAIGVTNETSLSVKYENGKFTVDGTTVGFETTNIKEVNYEPGNWVTVELKVFRGSDNKLVCGVYVGDTQVFYGVGNVGYSTEFALENFTFKQDSGVTTYLDEIILAAYPESYKPTTIPEEEPVEPDEDIKTNITYFDGSLLKTVGGTAFSENELPIKPTSANLYMYPLSTSTVKTQFIVKYSGCYGTGVSNAIENDNTYYVMNWSDIQSNYRTKVSDYMTAEKPVLSYSYDIRIPTTDSDKWRKSRFWLTSTEDAASSAENDIEIVIEYDDGKFFVNDFAGLETINRKPISYTPGNWINFEIRAYFITENKIAVGIYADGNQVYYGKGTSDYTNGLNLFMLRLISETTTNEEGITVTYDTHYDNIDVSVLPAKYIPTQMLSLSLADDNAKVEAKATVNGSYESLCLVTTVYNKSGSMEKLLVDTTIEDGVLSNVITGTDYTNYVKSGYIVKTFVFDSLTSAIPQIEHKTLTID